ncbi:MAG: adenylyltransferase/cytidyltransferase family protein [Planctomycetes bacterium]|nr:adenylyltransferase/cytidyltransferase family protein [Planctomycetota bacterium]MBI3846968.1 adenylyltransferase/cytidyltransferase family protein [Planctomycetota bacterium]
MAKIIENPKDLEGIVRGLQTQGKVVVFTNGVFDLLHVGHVRSLRDAKSRGDFLVVGVNTDESVKQFKDPNLPVNPLAERLEVLEQISMIDYITTIAEPTADSVLKILRPDLHAKGTDYTEATVPERATVLGYGGRVVIVGDPKAHSTSDIIRRIQGMASRRATPPIAPTPKTGEATKSHSPRAHSSKVYAGKAKVKVKVGVRKAAAKKPLRKKMAARRR